VFLWEPCCPAHVRALCCFLWYFIDLSKEYMIWYDMIIYYAVFLENHSYEFWFCLFVLFCCACLIFYRIHLRWIKDVYIYECIAGIISPCSSAGALLVVWLATASGISVFMMNIVCVSKCVCSVVEKRRCFSSERVRQQEFYQWLLWSGRCIIHRCPVHVPSMSSCWPCYHLLQPSSSQDETGLFYW